MNLDPVFRAAATSAVAILLGMPLLASAALEATPHGASSSVSVHYLAEPADWHNPYDYVGDAQTGTFSAAVPTSRTQTRFGRSEHLLDTRPGVLEATYGRPIANVDPMFQDIGGDVSGRWWDTWTVRGGAGSGTLRISLSYSADWIGDTFMTYVLEKRTTNSTTELFRIETGQNAMPPGDVVSSDRVRGSRHQFEIPFEYGQSFQLVSLLKGFQGNSYPEQTDKAIQSMSVEFLSVVLAEGATLEVSSGDASIYNVTAVPEPASWALMLLGFGGLGVALRRARRTGAGALS